MYRSSAHFAFPLYTSNLYCLSYVSCLLVSLYVFSFFFFFQAEDGIRDTSVTGVQTCALPICFLSLPMRRDAGQNGHLACTLDAYSSRFPAAAGQNSGRSHRADLHIGREAEDRKSVV